MSTAEKQTISQEQTVAALQQAYSMEIEAVANYLADSVNLEGVRAEEVKKSLAAEIQDELQHAQRLAHRIKQLAGLVPGATQVAMRHTHLDAAAQTTDVVRVIQAVIADEHAAIEHYKKLIRDTDGEDFVTQDLCISLLADEEEHLTQFEGFLKEYAPR